MKILLIGGTGVLSSAVTAEALKQGLDVTMINRGRRKLPNGVRFIKSENTDYDFIESKLKGEFFDAVIDFLCYTDKATTESFNLYSKFTKQYFFISSCAVYDTRVGGLLDESSPKVLPIWKYSVDKWASEQHLKTLVEKSDCKFTVIRPCITYGDTRIPYGISPQYGYHWTLCARILFNKPIIRWNRGINKCNITHVDDFAIGVVGLIGNSKAYNEVFNVCGEETPSFNDVICSLEEILGHKAIIVDVQSEFYAKEMPTRAGEILGGRSIDTINSNKKIKEVVPSFMQTITLKEGMKRTIEAYKLQNYQKGIDWYFDADTDRIIKKWSKVNEINLEEFNIKFIDYLGNASSTDKLTYWIVFHKDSIIIKMFTNIIRVITHLFKKNK